MIFFFTRSTAPIEWLESCCSSPWSPCVQNGCCCGAPSETEGVPPSSAQELPPSSVKSCIPMNQCPFQSSGDQMLVPPPIVNDKQIHHFTCIFFLPFSSSPLFICEQTARLKNKIQIPFKKTKNFTFSVECNPKAADSLLSCLLLHSL